jgi:hypothetical protein
LSSSFIDCQLHRSMQLRAVSDTPFGRYTM